MKTKKKIFILVSIVLIFFIFELFFFILNKSDFFRLSSYSTTNKSKLEYLSESFDDSEISSSYRPHPYFGFEIQTEWNEAYESDEKFVVALIGGSVAQYIVYNNSDLILKMLKDNFSCLKDKKLEILNLALYSMKQPQAFILSSFFSHKFDISINIEGYNEITSIQLPSHPLHYPWQSKVLFPKDAKIDYISSKLLILKNFSSYWLKLAQSSPSYFFKIIFKLFFKIIEKISFYYEYQLQESLKKVQVELLKELNQLKI